MKGWRNRPAWAAPASLVRAAFTATIALLFPVSLFLFGFGLLPIAAFIGALSAVLLVYNLARIIHPELFP